MCALKSPIILIKYDRSLLSKTSRSNCSNSAKLCRYDSDDLEDSVLRYTPHQATLQTLFSTSTQVRSLMIHGSFNKPSQTQMENPEFFLVQITIPPVWLWGRRNSWTSYPGIKRDTDLEPCWIFASEIAKSSNCWKLIKLYQTQNRKNKGIPAPMLSPPTKVIISYN